MSIEKLYDKVSYSLSENGKIRINNNEVSIRDAAFMCYYLIKKGDYNKVIAFIDSTAEKIKPGNLRYDETVLWLWILGEYLNETKEIGKSAEFSDTIDFCINYISQQWEKPGSNWLGIFDEGIYISNIAMAYRAIQSINNTIRSEKALKLLLNMQEFMYKKFLDEGKVVSRLGDKEIFGDISIIAVPFALLDAGNQILVQSINYLEKELVGKGVRLSKRDTFFGGCTRSDLTCLLSWYYSEKGDIARAKWLLEQVEKIWDRDGKLYVVDGASAKEKLYYDYFMDKNAGVIDESYLSYALYAIAKQNISAKEQMGIQSAEGIKILHNPKGTGNPYLSENKERYPNNPVRSDNVVLKMITQPFNISQEVYVEYSINGRMQKKVQMQIENSSEGEKYWKTSIGTFDYGDKVEYRFVVKADNTQVTSKTYQFMVREWQPVGNITHVCNNDDGIILYFDSLCGHSKRPCLKINKHDNKTVKWSFYVEDIALDDDKSSIVTGDVNIELDRNKLKIGFQNLFINISDSAMESILESYSRHGERFIELLTDKSGTIYKVRYKFLINGEERFFGMGERYSHMEYRGLNIDNCVYNQYRDQELRTYIPVPFAISSKGYGIYLDTTMYSIFRFGTRLNDMLEIEIDIHRKKQSIDTYVFIGNPKEIVHNFVKITGKPKLPPKWSFGPWMSSHNWDSQAETCKQVELTKKYEIPATVLVLEQWSDEATMYIFNDAQYQVKDGNDHLRYEDFTFPEWGRWPDPKKMADDLHKNGLKLLLWQVPVKKFMDGIAHAQKDEDERVMLEKGYHVKYEDGKPYRIPPNEWFKRSLIPDFSNPEAKEWWFNRRLYLVKDIGIDGFKTDGGECIYGEDLLFYDGRTGDEMRNQYINDFVGSYHQFTEEHVSDGGVTFSRSGYTGAQKYPLHWAGDNRSTFNTFRSSVRAGLSCSMSGIPFWGWDIGGFHGEIPTAELYIRSTQMAAFCPVMQYHAETKGEFNRDRTPWNIAERTETPYVIDIYKKYTDLRMNLIPYIYQQAIESSRTGIPMMRAMFLEYPNDTSCIRLDGQYFFGDSLLVAPVVEEGSFTKDVYIPEGKWMKFFTGEIVSGSRFITEEADIGHISVYVKENSIIPLNLSGTYKLFSYVGNRIDKYENLSFIVFVTDTVKYSFKDDMGNDININCCKSGNVLNIGATSNYDGDYALILKNCKCTVNITLNGKAVPERKLETLEAGSYAADGADLIIKVDGREKNAKIIIDK